MKDFNYKEHLAKMVEKAANERITKSQVAKAEAQRLRAEEAVIKAQEKLIQEERKTLLTKQGIRTLLELLLRRRTLLRNQADYDLLQLRLVANDSALNRQVDDLAEMFGVRDPSEWMDGDKEELWEE